jgi:hypothetical protein
MQRSDQINELAAALAKAQGAMSNAPKDGAIASGPKRYRYATLGSIWDACRPHLAANTLAVTQDAEVGAAGIKLTTLLMHGSGQFVSNELVMPVSSRDEKGIGQAMTYARKYALAAMVGVAPDDDEPRSAGGGEMGIHDKQIAAVKALCEELGESNQMLWARLSRQYATTTLGTLSEAQAAELCGQLRSELAARGLPAQLTPPQTPAAAAPAAAPSGGTPATLQEALAGEKAAGAVAARNGQIPDADLQTHLVGALSSLFALAPAKLQMGETLQQAEHRVYRGMLARRGVQPLLPPPPEVVRSLIFDLERKVAELVEARRAAGVTCTAPAVAPAPPAVKRPEPPY